MTGNAVAALCRKDRVRRKDVSTSNQVRDRLLFQPDRKGECRLRPGHGQRFAESFDSSSSLIFVHTTRLLLSCYHHNPFVAAHITNCW